MRVDEYIRFDATDLAGLVGRGEVTTEELRRAAGERHQQIDDTIHAVVEWYEDPDPVVDPGPDGGHRPLVGVPFLRKDYGSAEAGRLVEMGSRLALDHRASHTDEYYTRLKAAGVQVLGRTAVPELIQHGSTESRAFGVTRNPHDPTLSAGGSSGGAAAAVAAGVVPVAHASDCAGSIRIPAAVCGLVGLKPGRRRVPWAHGGWGGIAEEFVLTRSVRDARLFLDVLGQGVAPAPTSAPRVAISTEHWAGCEMAAEVVDVTHQVAASFEHLGLTVEEIEAPVRNEQLMTTWHALFSRWVAHDVATLERATGREAGPDNLEPLTLGLLDEVRRLTVDDVTRAQLTQGRVVDLLEQTMRSFDVLLTPTLGRPTIPLGQIAGEVESMDDYLRLNDEIFPYSFLFNVAGWPALSLPAGATAAGHPLGVQLAARWGNESLLLSLAEQLG